MLWSARVRLYQWRMLQTVVGALEKDRAATWISPAFACTSAMWLSADARSSAAAMLRAVARASYKVPNASCTKAFLGTGRAGAV